MKKGVRKDAGIYSEYSGKHKRITRRRRIVTCLAAVVVFCTVYALILPAITLEKQDCTLPEHTHTEECYAVVEVTETETETETETATETETETEAVAVTETEVVTEPETTAETEVVAEPETTAETEVVTEPETTTETEVVTETETEVTTETEPEIEITTGTETVNEITTETETETETETVTEVESETVITVDTYSAPETEVTTGTEPEPETISVPEETTVPEEIPAPEETPVPVKTERLLVCGLEEHVHNESCGKPYTDKLFSLLPDPTEVMDSINAYREAGDSEGLDSYISGLRELIERIGACATDEEQNAKLEAIGILLDADGGTVKEIDDAVIITDITAEPVGIQHTDSSSDTDEELPVLTGDILTYSFRLTTGTTDGESCTGRVRVRFTLSGAEFDLTDTLIEEPEISSEDDISILEGYVTTGAPGECYVSVNVIAGETGVVSISLSAGEKECKGDMVIVGASDDTLEEDPDCIAEAAHGDNWKILRDSGWFEEYSDYAYVQDDLTYYASDMMVNPVYEIATLEDMPSDVQINARGGEKSDDTDNVTVSKTIAGTDLENVFDITLKVSTTSEIQQLISEPDMAVVIVMDISNTMSYNFGNTTRYKAAMDAAETFLDKFAESNSLGVSKIGYVAFNTDAHQIFGLQTCTNPNQAGNLKNTMRTQTGNIINASGYGDSHSRFTNIEAGLKMASDMLKKVSNRHKYIIFLSDGFPTTYISNGYSGYDTYDKDGKIFVDTVLGKPCTYGTSYSNEAAIRARQKATSIKNSGTKIFSIGVDVGGQTIQQYVEQSEKADGFSVVDRRNTNYEIGSATSAEAYKNWLRDKIGSNYYFDSTDTNGLKAAYDDIFSQIKTQVEKETEADWVASDPIPGDIEFIKFNDSDNNNSVSYDPNTSTIKWNLKESGCTTNGSTKTYEIVYRVRLKNEDKNFAEGNIYNTNGDTKLQYRTLVNENGALTVSEPKYIDFPIPSVHGFLGELNFTKQSLNATAIPGAEFTLAHDDQSCPICRGDGENHVNVPPQTATSGADGKVTFNNIPSGHTYTLTETKVPTGYSPNGDKYTVVVAYDIVTVKVNGNSEQWNGNIVNTPHIELPSTGSSGTIPYTISGTVLILASILLMYKSRRRDD